MKIWINIYKIETDLSSCGMGRIYFSLCEALQNIGIDYTKDNPKEKCLELWIGGNWSPTKLYEANDNILFGLTTGESLLNNMPHFDMFDHFFVNTDYYRKVQKIDKPVSIWHLGIDSSLFPYSPKDNEIFEFLHFGICQYRKGSHLACMAFDREFSVNENVRLIMRSSGETEFYHALRQAFAHNPNIIFQTGYVDIKKISSVYKSDCLVFPSLREGWGLHLTEAMATGMPAIISGIPSLQEQFDDRCGWVVDTDSDFEFIGGNLPSINDLMAKMRYAYSNPNECKDKGIFASEFIHKNFTWEKGIELGLLPIMRELNIL